MPSPANGAGIDYSYDTASRLLDVNNVTDTGQLKYAYSYDDVRNRLSMSVTDSSGTKIHVYDYDNIYQLTDVNYPEDFDYLATDTTFNYDEVGNRTSVDDDDGTVNYTANALNQYTGVADANLVYDDNGNMIFDGRYEYSYDAENRLIQVNNVQGDSLAAACDSDLWFTTGGDAEWFAQSAEYYADNDAAQSGAIGSGQETWMQTTVVGPGNISFYYKMSSVSGDALAFYVDAGVVASWSQGSTWPWTGNISVPAGPHTLKWKYYKYSGSTEGSCWIDAIQWQPQVSTASYLQDPLDTDLVVYTGGDSSWSETTSVYYYDNDSAYGGLLDDNKQSMILVNVEGSGTVTFWWKVSSEANYDWLSFYADGVLQDRISGEVGWQQKSYPLGGDGTHALVWVYSNDSNDADGSDRGWVDYLQWTPSGGGGGSSTTDWEQITYTYDPSGRRIAKLVSPPGGGDVDGEVTKAVCRPMSAWRCGLPPDGRRCAVHTLARHGFSHPHFDPAER